VSHRQIDVEGAEKAVIQGAEKTIRMVKPAMYFRVHVDATTNTLSSSTQRTVRYIDSLNYDMYWHFTRSFIVRSCVPP
jgi:hypothetical protein